MDSTSKDVNLADLMREHTAAVLRHESASAKRMGLETSELAALEHLQDAGPMTMGTLGEMLSLSRGAITAMVDRLESKGYVERVPNPEDRRSALVRITSAGLDCSLGHLWPYIEEMRGLDEKFSREERRIIARFLTDATAVTHRHSQPGA